MVRPSLRVEIVLTLTIALVAASFLIAIVVMAVTKKNIIAQKVESAATLVNFLQYSIDSICYGSDEAFDRGDENWRMQRLTRLFTLGKEVKEIFVIDKRGKILASNNPEQVGTSGEDRDLRRVIASPEILTRLPKGSPVMFSKITDDLTVSAPVFLKSRVVGAVRMTLSLSDMQGALRRSYRLVLTYIIFNSLVIIIFGSILLSRSIVRPIQKLVNATESISKGDFSQYVENKGRNEIGHLSLAFNRMAARIQEHQHQLQTQIVSLERLNRQLQESQREVIASEKLALVGKLAAGVAHEIGNPLSAVLGYTGLLQKKENLDCDSADYLMRVEKELNRINQTIRELLDFSRIGKTESVFLNLRQVIEASLSLVTHQKNFHAIQLISHIDEGLEPLEGDEHQFQQVILNFLLNAGDAVGEAGIIVILADGMTCHDGKLTAFGIRYPPSLFSQVPDFGLGGEEVLIDGLPFPPGETVIRILVADNGQGILPEHLEKIFDPFFTTREPGKGTGLGLAICNRIIESYGGTIIVRSQLGKGSAFLILVPAKGKHHA